MNRRQVIRSFIAQNYYVADAAEISDEESLLGRGILDSTGVLELVSFLEDRFGVAVDDAEIVPANLDSIDRIDLFLERKTAASAA